MVGVLATVVVIAAMNNIGVDTGRWCPDVSRIALETRVCGVVVIVGTRDGWFDQADGMHDAGLVVCVRIAVVCGVGSGGVVGGPVPAWRLVLGFEEGAGAALSLDKFAVMARSRGWIRSLR